MASVELPPMSAEQQEVSLKFCDHLQGLITRDGAIPFSDYMQRSLYEPGLGYYVNGFSKLGRDGDFVTAPEISNDFAHCLAELCVQVLNDCGGGDILEFGGGSGVLAADILLKLHELQCLPNRYFMLDVSADLQDTQQQLLSQKLPAEVFKRVVWVSEIPNALTGVVIANEVFDAFSVERFVVDEGCAQQLVVDYIDSGFTQKAIASASVRQQVDAIIADTGVPLAENYCSEYCLWIKPWCQSLAQKLDKAAVVICDYGAERKRYYSPHNSSGTLRCFFRHTVHDDPFARPAVQDITADVDFTAVAEAATDAGLELQGFAPLSQFMLSLGALERLENRVQDAGIRQQIEATGNLKKIIMPQEMGDRFMVIAFSKQIDLALGGFSMADWSRLL